MSELDEFRTESLKALLGYQAKGHGRTAEQAKKTAARMGISLPEDPRQAASVADEKLTAVLKEMFSSGGLSQVPSGKLVELAEGTAALCLYRNLKVSQIRNFFGHVKRLSSQFRTREFCYDEVDLLRIPLVYSRGRNDAVDPLYRTCMSALEGISFDPEQGFQDFVKFEKLLEAIVAYHKFYGGSE